jgi:multicomponent Na+:H+ antiporter subunit G
MTIVVALLLLVGLFFHAVAALGVIRMPDFYTRLHAVSKAETLGVVFTVAAVMVETGVTLTTVKLGFVAVFLFLANPTSAHAIGRAAYRTGMPPWIRPPGTRP